MDKTNNNINWFEVPVTDIERAKAFYKAVFSLDSMEDITVESQGIKMAFFPYEPGSGKLAGALVQGPGYMPSMDGVLIYFNGDPDLSVAESKIEPAGGKIIMPKTSIGQHGFMAIFTDTEGNKLALHSNG